MRYYNHMIRLLLLIVLLVGCQPDEVAELPTRVSLPTPTAEVVGQLEFWQAAQGNLLPGGTDIWTFTAQADDQIGVRVVGLDARLTLRTANGDILQQGDQISTTLSASGQYRVTVTSATNGPYEIGLRHVDQRQNMPTALPQVVGVPTPSRSFDHPGTYIGHIDSGESAGGTLQANSPDHIYTFDGETGQYIQLELQRVSGALDPAMTLYAPDGGPIAFDDDSGGSLTARLHNILLPADGLYSVQVSGSEAEGGYALRLLRYQRPVPITPTVVAVPTETPAPTYAPATPVRSDTGLRLVEYMPVVSVADSPGYLVIYSFSATAGDFITVGAGPYNDSQVRPQIEIVDPDGSIVARAGSISAGANGDALATFIVPLDGIYQVFVGTEDNQTGEYIIAYGRGPGWLEQVEGFAARDETIENSLDRRGQRDVWMVELRAGDIITVAANPENSLVFDPALDIAPATRPDLPLAFDDNSGGNRGAFMRSVNIPETGLYLLRVYGSGAGSTGAYRLVWRYINVAPTPTVPPAVYPLLVLDETVADNEYLFFPFQGRTGQQIQVRVEGVDFDPLAALVDPSGTVILEVDDVDGNLNPSFMVTLPESGTYNIRVNGYISGGTFRLTVEERF